MRCSKLAGCGMVAAVGCVLLVVGGCVVGGSSVAVDVVAQDTPPGEGGNTHYAGNREPLLPSELIKLPVGSIRPAGWVRHQLELMADGMIGRLPEVSKWCQFAGNAWTDSQGQGEHGWEELPYWLKGFIDLGYLLEDERIKAEAGRWVEAVLASRREEGYFGPQANRDNLDFWPHMVMVCVLRSAYEATGDERIVELLRGYFRYLANLPPEKLYTFSDKYRSGWWQTIRAADHLDAIHWLYNLTGEKWLLDLAKRNHGRTADWTGGIPSWHGVNICQAFRGPAQYYVQSHDHGHLQATERNYATVMGLYGQVPGGMFGADENAREGYIGPRQAAETCSMVELMFSHEILCRITGQVVWADRCEGVAFNSLPAALTADHKALKYLTAPNMVQLDRSDKSPMLQNRGNMLSFNPYEQYRCCQHNVSHGWPYYVGHLWMATQGNGLAAVLYAASRVEARVGERGVLVRISETTDYPFGEQVGLVLEIPEPVAFPLTLRVPGWCDSPQLAVNGVPIKAVVKAGQWLTLRRTWRHGDRVDLALPMSIKVRVWEKNGGCVSVDRGPLTYSLRIGERWQAYQEKPAADQPPRSDRWPCHEVFPTTPWNYGLLVDPAKPADAFDVVVRSGPLAGQPFTPEAAPVMLLARGRKIPAWQQEENGLVGKVPTSPAASDEPTERLTLIPMGCARLRISAFPVIAAPAK